MEAIKKKAKTAETISCDVLLVLSSLSHTSLIK
jgi:hypothetical protein